MKRLFYGLQNATRGDCEIFGLDPLYLANEGKLIAIVSKEDSESLLKAMQKHPAGKDSRIIGYVEDSSQGKVILETDFGRNRMVDASDLLITKVK